MPKVTSPKQVAASLAGDECRLLLIERKSTLHTGTTMTDKTRSLAEQLRPT